MSLPPGFRLARDRATRAHDDGRIVIGGSPRRVLRLTDTGADVAQRLLSGDPIDDMRDAALARRLLDAGVAHPVPPARSQDVEVVIPVHDDAAGLARCLAALDGIAVTVVDDASADEGAVREVAERHGAGVIRLATNSGPAAARNAGAARASADVVAFVDSDAVVDTAALRTLSAHFADAAVVAVAPRVRAATTGAGALGALAAAWSPLDLGREPAPVHPAGRVPYVPSTVLLVRRDALARAGGFDESLRYGEDVDLVWRLTSAGGRVRYDPAVSALHAEPSFWSAWLRRRVAYGSSAGPLAARHGGRAAPLRLQPAPAATLLLALLGRPALATGVAAGTAWRLRRRLRAAAVPADEATTAALLAPAQTALGAARWATQLWWPAMLLVATRSRRHRVAVLAAMAAPPLIEWRKRRPAIDPLRWTAAVWADEAAYGIGVWRGCLRARSFRPLVPAVDVTGRSRSRHVSDTRR